MRAAGHCVGHPGISRGARGRRGRARSARRRRRACGRSRRCPRGRRGSAAARRGGSRSRLRALRVGRDRTAAARHLCGRGRVNVRSPWMRVVLVVLGAAGAVAIIWWRGPAWSDVTDAFTIVSWRWVVAAIALNLASVVVRSVAWRTVIDQAVPPPLPAYRTVFAAFSVGLFANAVLPGRIGELARVAVLNRRMPARRGLWATLVGTVFAHRVFDLPPVLALILFVVLTAQIPHWAAASLVVFVVVG